MFRFIYIITFIFIRLFFPCKIENKENYLRGKPVIIVANHLSNLDPVYIFEYLPDKKYALAKKEMFKNKFLSWFWRGMGLISIDRQKSDFTALKTSLKVLKDGKKLVIFPEGTRNKINTELQEIKSGTALFAIKAKVPVLPMWIEKRGKIFRRNKITIGEAFELNEFYDKKLDASILEDASKVIYENLNALSKNKQ